MSTPAISFKDYDTRLAAYAVVIDAQERILLARWNTGPTPEWSLPGGGVEFDETVEQAAVREVSEETGYQITLEHLLGVDCNMFRNESETDGSQRPLKGVRVIFRARVVGGSLRHEVGGSTDEARWVPLAEVKSLPRVSLVDAAIAMSRA